MSGKRAAAAASWGATQGRQRAVLEGTLRALVADAAFAPTTAKRPKVPNAAPRANVRNEESSWTIVISASPQNH